MNSAGLMLSSAITEGDVEAWEAMIDVNIKGTLYTINAVLPSMLNQSSGHIINIASISGFEVTKKSTLYSYPTSYTCNHWLYRFNNIILFPKL